MPLGGHHGMSPLHNCHPDQPLTAGILLRLNREQVGGGWAKPEQAGQTTGTCLKSTRTSTPSCCVEMLLQDANPALGSELLTSTR